MSKSSIRNQRLSRGMQGNELARRMGVSPARVCVMEKDEPRGALTLNMMQRAAEALDCDFVYQLVPKTAVAKRKVRLNTELLKADTERQRDVLTEQLEDELSS